MSREEPVLPHPLPLASAFLPPALQSPSVITVDSWVWFSSGTFPRHFLLHTWNHMLCGWLGGLLPSLHMCLSSYRCSDRVPQTEQFKAALTYSTMSGGQKPSTASVCGSLVFCFEFHRVKLMCLQGWVLAGAFGTNPLRGSFGVRRIQSHVVVGWRCPFPRWLAAGVGLRL